MDAATHIIWGAAVALLPVPLAQKTAQTAQTLSLKQRMLVAGVAALFPDIDYLVLLWNPLEFLAYWHRVETHSLLVAPLWAGLLALIWRRYTPWRRQGTPLFWLSLAGILSHILLDSLTVFGTAWFAPFSSYRIAWDTLVVIDGYFTFCSILTLGILIRWRKHSVRWFGLILPLSYLGLVLLIRQDALQQVEQSPDISVSMQSRIKLLPQPFSPVYWQVVIESVDGTRQAWLKQADDRIAGLVASWFGFDLLSGAYRKAPALRWRHYPLNSADTLGQRDITEVWNHPKFKPFRDYSRYPVLYRYQQSDRFTCVWFSDLRYQWPYMEPSFRFGMCHGESRHWRLYRMRDFDTERGGSAASARVRALDDFAAQAF